MITTVLESGLRERKKRETRARILDAAFELFRAQGYEQTTLTQIAQSADVAPRTVSNYFPLKVDLLVAYREQMLGVVENALREPRDDDPFRRVRRALAAVSRENERHPSGRLLQWLLSRHGSYHALENIQERFRADLVATLRGSHQLRADADLDLAVLALSASFLALLQRWASGSAVGLPRQAERLFDQWARGVMA